MTRPTWRITSGPMPSPGRTRSFRFAAMMRSGPGLAGAALRLEGGDRALLLQRDADIVESVQQAMLAEGIDVEMNGGAVRPGDLLLLEIDGQAGIGALLRVLHEERHRLGRQLDRQHAVPV